MSIEKRSRIIKIGNSQGICIPRPILDQFDLVDEVDLDVQDGALVINPATRPRQGWEEYIRRMAQTGDDRLLDSPASTRWDDEKWTW